jgi:5'-3' exonuclease
VVEADDGIAQYVIEKELQGEYNIVISGDKDLCQLISDQTFVYFLNKNVLIDKDNYNEYFNHYIENYLTVKAIDGDTSDTIKGVPRIGEKTLLKYFPKLKTELFSVNEMREEIDRIQSERKRPLKTLQTLQEGITPNDKGECIFNRNITLMDLSNPIMDDECREDIFDLATLPLDPDERDIKTLLNMMMDDGFMLLAPGGWDGYIEFLRPFDIIINQEKKLYYELQKEKTQV